PTGNLPTFYDEFAAKGWPVDREVFTKGAVALDANGEPDSKAVAALQQAQPNRPSAPQVPSAPQEPLPPAPPAVSV
ncbi:MAG: hypothetical protein J6Q05_00025, partial [Elusimicrobiaceae bacterium]|nr:hypothetical protein [Elusimicrobiaceae bacterium]